MKSVALNAFPRTLTRRPGAKQLRLTSRIPAVIYGRQTQPLNLELKLKDFEDLLHRSASETILVDLSIDGQDAAAKRLALVQEIQHHPLSGKVMHVDFHQVAEDEKVTVNLPVESVGEALGVKTNGGILEHVLFKIKLRGFPKDLPEVIEVDVSHLDVGQAIHLGEIKLPPGWRPSGTRVSRSLPLPRRLPKRRKPPRSKPPPRRWAKPKSSAKRRKARRKLPRRRATRRVPLQETRKVPLQETRRRRRRRPRRQPKRSLRLGRSRIEAIRPGWRGSGPARGWRTCISLWVWATPGRATSEPDTMPGFWPWTGWPRAGSWNGRRESNSTRAGLEWTGMVGGCCWCNRRRI